MRPLDAEAGKFVADARDRAAIVLEQLKREEDELASSGAVDGLQAVQEAMKALGQFLQELDRT